MENPLFRYSDLRFALEWSEEVKNVINKLDESHQGLKDSVKLSHGYLKRYCEQIKLEEK